MNRTALIMGTGRENEESPISPKRSEAVVNKSDTDQYVGCGFMENSPACKPVFHKLHSHDYYGIPIQSGRMNDVKKNSA